MGVVERLGNMDGAPGALFRDELCVQVDKVSAELWWKAPPGHSLVQLFCYKLGQLLLPLIESELLWCCLHCTCLEIRPQCG